MLNSINNEIPLFERNQILIVYKLNTMEKVCKFFETLKQLRGQTQNDGSGDSESGSQSKQGLRYSLKVIDSQKK